MNDGEQDCQRRERPEGRIAFDEEDVVIPELIQMGLIPSRRSAIVAEMLLRYAGQQQRRDDDQDQSGRYQQHAAATRSAEAAQPGDSDRQSQPKAEPHETDLGQDLQMNGK